MTLGSYHPIVEDNVRRLRAISGLDDVSFHMSGTEAVMQAVRLARYHTAALACRPVLRRVPRLVGRRAGGRRQSAPAARDLHAEGDGPDHAARAPDARRHRVRPGQSHPGDAPQRRAARRLHARRERSERPHYDRAAYGRWLADLREVCTERGIVLIIDDVFLGFRLAIGGTQEYFGVRADLVTYGKTLGGGLPVGVVCGRRDLMRRFRDDRPADICFARGTFNSHPVVMATMNEFLRHLDEPAVKEGYRDLDARWNERARELNAALEGRGLPIRVANMTSVWTTLYLEPSRYNWMLQYYLRAQGLSMSWIGTGRFVFSHDLEDERFRRNCRAHRRRRRSDAVKTASGGGATPVTNQIDQAWSSPGAGSVQRHSSLSGA